MKKKTLSEQAYETIKQMIIYCEIEPGKDIDQKELAQTLGYNSVTPVREALILLQNEKLVEIFPRKGIRVSEVSYDDVVDNYQLREIMEPTVFMYTASQISEKMISYHRNALKEIENTLDKGFDLRNYLQLDMAFHLDLLAPLNNRNLASVLRGVYEQNARYRMSAMMQRDPRSMLAEHMHIIDALSAKDYTAAIDYLKEHIINSRQSFSRSVHHFIRR